MKTVVERFEAKLEADVHTDCVLWTGAVRYGDSYGSFGDRAGHVSLAHRWAYEHYVGPIPRGHVVHHRCRNRRCVNPEHLQAVTQAENLRHCNDSYTPMEKRERPDRRARLLSKIDKQADGCWHWMGAMVNGYGRFGESASKRSLLAYRVVYEELVGPVPEGLYLDHLCRNRACCNPAHLEPVTMRENLLRGAGFSAVNAQKTECVNGHPFTPENTYHRRDRVGRLCRACHLSRQNARHARQRGV